MNPVKLFLQTVMTKCADFKTQSPDSHPANLRGNSCDLHRVGCYQKSSVLRKSLLSDLEVLENLVELDFENKIVPAFNFLVPNRKTSVSCPYKLSQLPRLHNNPYPYDLQSSPLNQSSSDSFATSSR